MRSLVIYYSNSGNTQKVAKMLADRLGADLAEITCATYLRWYGPIAMAWDIFTRHIPKVDVLVPPGANYDQVVVGGPVWAAHAAPPILALGEKPFWGQARIAFFVTCSGTSPKSPPQPAVDEMKNLISPDATATMIFREADIRSDRIATLVDTFAGILASEMVLRQHDVVGSSATE
jgi:flavodoxin